MKSIKTVIAMSAIAGGAAWSGGSFAAADDNHAAHAVFVMTNNADANQVIAFERGPNGTLGNPHTYGTDGRGSGGTVDPLASQGSLTLSTDRAWLFAVNAGSGSVSVFRVNGAQLELTDRAATEGSEPNSVAQFGSLVYVLNTAGSSSVVGFHFHNGKLDRIPNSLRFLSGNTVASGSVAFSPDGQFLIVTEKATNNLDVFKVLSDGTLSQATITKSVGPGAFSAGFTRNDVVLVSETGAGGPNSSAISSYAVQSNGTLTPISSSVPTLGSANCWNAVTADGRFVYVSNAGSGSISGFAIGGDGSLTPLPGTVLALNPTGSSNIDITVSSDGKFLYSLNAGTGAVGIFAIQPTNGTLTDLGTAGSLAAAAGLNGIAAN
jgi:6-phosphogluconolactonase (cycloisomerase 2 family)